MTNELLLAILAMDGVTVLHHNFVATPWELRRLVRN